MPTVFRFRVTFDDYEDVSRDIEIKSTQNFEELHFTIQSAIGFDAKKPASFYVSNDLWKKGQEICSIEKTDKEGNTVAMMKDSRLADFIADPHQKFLYYTDPDSSWTLQMELVKILPQADDMRNYPVCVKSVGDAPRQYPLTTAPKVALSPEDDLESLLTGNHVLAVEDDVEDEVESDSLIDESENGVDEEELEGMSEEGEEEESEEDSEEMGFADSEGEDQQSDDY